MYYACKACGTIVDSKPAIRQHFVIKHGRTAKVEDVQEMGGQTPRADRSRMHFT